MAYKIMKNLIYKKSKTKEELLRMCEVYYGTGRLSEAEYLELIELINGLE